ncbi:DNA ligase 4-like protein 1 [Colletotrichum chlorophyti]|uniref:DNA ligase 4-like protein 1 n=1 Tax=Colletotrichum chlorophyti TaxID=708187 RepID=A0A1Q8RCL2_9PEZI|nr:DNA ligase 4-like protein 1 [Colletotrichum chlorophyti]
MPFSFVHVCDLLEQAYRQCTSGNQNVNQRVSNWFTQHRRWIDDPQTDASALLSTLLPERRTDRVYGIQASLLSNIIGRTLCLGQSRRMELKRYEEPGRGEDLADCVARILKETPNPVHAGKDAVTVEEIDTALNALAASCRFSSPAVRASVSQSTNRSRDDVLGRLYLRLQAREAKWLTRLILKNYQSVKLDPNHVYFCYDPFLPIILSVQDHISAAISLLGRLKEEASFRQGTREKRQADLLKHLTPVLGVKVGRQVWLKGRSIKHCLRLGHGRMSCEKKVDGEYCQIHVDLSKGKDCIQIFSKSGKDSTRDRAALHGAIKASLNIGKPTCKLTKGCILEGELAEKRIMPFHKIRKYVSRSGRFLHTEADSQCHDYEHLMIIYYDVLLVDGESLLSVRQNDRFKRLCDLIICREGHAQLVERQVISFDHDLGAHYLRKAFAECITAREEGLVLKPNDPYFDFSENRRPFSGHLVKLKKEYIGSFGDVGDFAVVAARYDADKAKLYRIPNLQWTHFYLGCLDNKEDIQRFQARPEFTVVQQVEINETLLKTVITYGAPNPVPFEDNHTLILHIPPGIAQQKIPSVVFTEPLVFDVRCFSFDKEGNTGFWQPRFPQVSKVHFDRSFVDTISFSELQTIAKEATTAPSMEDSQEMLTWIAALEGADPRGIAIDTVSQSTTTSLGTYFRNSSVRPSTSPAPSNSRSPIRPRRSVPALLGIPESTLVIPPTTTDSQGKISESGDENVVGEPPKIDNNNKRIAEESTTSPSSSKRLKTPSESRSVNEHVPEASRRPLVEMSINQTSPSPQASQIQPVLAANFGTTEASKNSTASMDDLENQADPVTQSPLTSHETNQSSQSPVVQPRRQCKLAGANCIFANWIAILSPCIAQQHWITDDLLSTHGIPRGSATYPNPTPPSSISSLNPPPTGGRIRKVYFVEHNRREATRAFMSRLDENPEYRSSGRREWREVYDWRILEDVSALEWMLRGSQPLANHPHPKRKWLVGLV